MKNEMAMRLLHATREQLHGKPTHPSSGAVQGSRESSISLYQREYDEAERYLLDHGYIEPY